MQPGIYPGLPFSEYLAISAINKSSLQHIARSAAHYKYEKTQISQGSAAMAFGTAVHTAVLEPEKFDEIYVTVPEDAPKKPTAAQINAKKPSEDSLRQMAWWAEFNTANAGRTVLSLDEWNTVLGIRKVVQEHPAYEVLFQSGDAEATLVWEDPETGVLCKGRLDWLSGPGSVVVDIKTTEDASYEAFSRSCARFHYHVQAAWYLDGLRSLGFEGSSFVFCAIERDAPHGVAFYQATEEMILKGREIYRAWLTRYRQCAQLDEWPGYPVIIQDINLPAWAMKEKADGTIEF